MKSKDNKEKMFNMKEHVQRKVGKYVGVKNIDAFKP